MAQIDIDKFVISLRRCFGENKGIATTLDRCLFSLGLKYVDTPTGGRLERVDQPTMLEKIMWGSDEQKSAEWSEEDEKMLKCLCRIVHSQRVGKVITLREESELGKWIDKWLNHNPQPHWKPSDEQLNSLYDVLNPCDGLSREVLESLYVQLKELKGE